MRDGRRLAILVLVDALLTLGVVHRAQQHQDAIKVRSMAVDAIDLSRLRQEAMR
jgi:hypothetical protein